MHEKVWYGKRSHFEAGKQGPQIKTGRHRSRGTGGHPHWPSSGRWGLSLTELHPPHTHIKDSTSPPGFQNATVLLPRGQTHWVPHWLPKQIHSIILVSFTDSFLPSLTCLHIHSLVTHLPNSFIFKLIQIIYLPIHAFIHSCDSLIWMLNPFRL